MLLQGSRASTPRATWARTSSATDGIGYAWWAAFLLELLLTALFIIVILAVTDARYEHPALAPLAIGLTLAAIHFVAIPATGTSVNPARSIGPALFAGSDAIIQLWLFILAPLVGAAIAGLAYPLLFGHGTDPVPGSGLSFARPAPPRCRATAHPTSSSRSGTSSRPPGPGRVGAGADHPGRLAVGPRRPGVEAAGAVAGAGAAGPGHPGPGTPTPAPAQPTPGPADASAARSPGSAGSGHGDHPDPPAGSRPVGQPGGLCSAAT